MRRSILDILKGVLSEGAHDGFSVDREGQVEGSELLITIDGVDYAISAEAF